MKIVLGDINERTNITVNKGLQPDNGIDELEEIRMLSTNRLVKDVMPAFQVVVSPRIYDSC